ncbi:MAG: site-2 protease family protein [Patescibacteria group bacterium]|jgi:Zn-dependent protease
MLLRLLFTDPLYFVTWTLAIIVGITVHEFSHAWAATMQGDRTPGQTGRLSLNPLAHLDPLGTLMLLIVGFGYGKPVQFDPHQLRNRRFGPALVGVAGPLSNLAMIIVFGLALKVLVFQAGLTSANLLVLFLTNLVQINVILMVFNLFPIPPLDGSKVLFAILPHSMYEFKLRLEQYGPFILLGLLIFGQGLFSVVFNFFLNLVGRVFA